ncbi:uncharacterized protein A4U43_C02F4910 [Asparagus officinalis]|uniref:ApaG domain-containing protein n=1 Tax=Asparagus officinalis TaxID=4686 RepID=A0A5P1FK14_ASPOF|nr:F-box protein SKIP16 [Asparagus officinalis]ONK77279.1 uncharacterized protein A4U43_C02F4910 [Asparagus officinalis]
MEVESMGLEGLGDLILETIISKLDPENAASIACASTKLKAAACDENLWRIFCARDFDLDSPLDPEGNPCPSFKVAYKVWIKSFGMYPLPIVKRVKQLWSAIKSWMAVNFPEANGTLRKGASEVEIRNAEESLGIRLPTATKVLYRFCDGQDTICHSTAEHKRLAPLGIIGGYEFYNHVVNVHLLPLSQIIEETKDVAMQIGFSVRSKYIIVAASYYYEKWFFLNSTNKQLYVGTRNLLSDGEMLPCVPQALLRQTSDVNNDMSQDALLLWLEEHCRRLQGGMIKTRMLHKMRTISLYPEAPPACSVAVTNGVQVRASAVFVPEMSDLNGGEEKYYYSYSVRLSLLPDGCILDGTYYSSCQLYSRHWIIRSKDVVVSDVSGEAVIGEYPLLLPNEEEFVYESCTPLPAAPGSVEGSFTFVPGRLRKPEGRQFDVKVAPFPLEEPGYIF